MKRARTRPAAVSALTIALSSGVAAVATASAAPMTSSAAGSAAHVARPAKPAHPAHPAKLARPAHVARPAHAADRGRRRIRAVVLNCRGRARVYPRRFVITCADANDRLAGLRWSSWDRPAPSAAAWNGRTIARPTAQAASSFIATCGSCSGGSAGYTSAIVVDCSASPGSASGTGPTSCRRNGAAAGWRTA